MTKSHLAKRSVSLILALTLLLGIMPVIAGSVEAAGGDCGDGLNWSLQEDSFGYYLKITASYYDKHTYIMDDYQNGTAPWESYDGNGGKKIYGVYLDRCIKSIGDYAFAGLFGLKHITLPSELERIGSYSFYNCRELDSIEIPFTVNEIEDSAFEGCKTLQSVVIPGSVQTLDAYVFLNCSSLESVAIKNGVTEIKFGAFSGCSALKNITIPASVVSIDDCAFSGCSALPGIELHEGLETIGERTFDSCTSLQNINIPGTVSSIGPNALQNTAYCNNDENWTGDLLYLDNWLIYGKESTVSCTISEGTVGIAGGAFQDNSNLSNVTLPESLKVISSKAFSGASALEQLVLPESVETIESYAFEDCSSIAQVCIPDSVTALGRYAFYNCTSLKSVTLSKNLTDISARAFDGCAALESITIPYNVKEISWDAFANCGKLRKFIILNPECVISSLALSAANTITAVYTTVYGWPGSSAQEYATKYGYDFAEITNCGEGWHTEVIDEGVPPTCTEAGISQGIHCALCGYVLVAQEVLDPLGHAYTYINNGGNHTVGCSNCTYSAEEAHKFIGGTCACGAAVSTDPIYDETLKFNMDIAVGAEMLVNYNFMASVVSKYTDFYIEIRKDVAGGETVITTFGIGEDRLPLESMKHPATGMPIIYNASYTGIAAKEMGDNFETTLYAVDSYGRIYCSKTIVSTIKDYLLTKINDANSSKEMKTMAVDMLNYGALAQLRFNYNTANLVNADLTIAQSAYATKGEPTAVDSYSVTGSGANVSTNITIGSKVELSLSCIVVGLEDPLSVECVITDVKNNVIARPEVTNKSGVMFTAKYDNVGAREMRKIIKATFYDGSGNVISKTVSWSVESYVAQIRAMPEATMREVNLVNAMLIYGDSVGAYLTSNGQ